MNLISNEGTISLLSNLISESCKNKRPCAVVVDPRLNSALSLLSTNSSITSSSSTSSSFDILLRSGATQIFNLSQEEIEWKEDGAIIFILRPSPQASRLVALQMRAIIRVRSKPDFKVIFLPRRSYRCEEILKEEGVLSWFSQGIHGVHLGFVPIENDILSLEYDDFLKETKITGDTSCYSFIARSLLDFGTSSIKLINCKGNASKEVLDLYMRMQRELSESSNNIGEYEDNNNDNSSIYSNSSNQQSYQEYNHQQQVEEEEEEDMKIINKVGGPLDIYGGFPRLVANHSVKKGNKQIIDTLIILDREMDMLSPLCTPLTYESLLDESFMGLKNGFLNIKSSILNLSNDNEEEEGEEDNNYGKQQEENENIQLSLIDDPLFKEIRNVSVTVVMKILNEKAKELKETQERVHRTREVEDLQEFVKRIPELQLKKKKLTTHIALGKRVSAITMDKKFVTTWRAERACVIEGDGKLLLERAQDFAARGDSLFKVLRLLCLNCILTGGFTTQKLDEIRQDLIHVYGFEIIFTLDNLEKIGLLSTRLYHPQHRLGDNSTNATTSSTSNSCIFTNWQLIKKNFKLIMENIDDFSPSDCSYVFSGLAPLSVRLVQLAISPGWDNKRDLLRMLNPAPQVCDAKPILLNNNHHNSNTMNTKKKIMMVLYLGGISYAEIAALRFISEQPDCPYQIIIVTTSIINGTNLIKSLSH